MISSRVVQQKDLYHMKSVQVFEREHLELAGRIAVAFVERWGAVAASPDGEDTAGRQKLRLQSTEELVERALHTAELLVDRLRDRGHIHVAPDMPGVEAETPE